MSNPRSLLLLILMGCLLFLAACILNNTVPELEKPTKPTPPLEPSDVSVRITAPDRGADVAATSSMQIQVSVSGVDYLPAVLEIVLNDSLFDEKDIFYGSGTSFSGNARPGEWADPGSPLEIKAIVTDAIDSTFADTLEVHVEAYLESPPVLKGPGDRQLILLETGASVELSVESYSDRRSYSFCVATDSLFSDEICYSSTYTNYSFVPLTEGFYYWRVKVLGDYDLESPWSETRRFGVMNGISYSTDFLSLSQIERVVKGADSYYLLGRVGEHGAVMKCNDEMSRLWNKTFSMATRTAALDCDELADGSLYVAVNSGYYTRNDWIYLLASSGQAIWNRAIDPYSNITSIAATSDDMLVAGFLQSTSPSIVKMDTTGSVAWEFGGETTASCQRIHGDRTEGKYTFLMRNGAVSYRLGELDLFGNLNWESSFNVAASGYEENYVLTPLSNGDFIFGSTVDPNSGSNYVYFAKVSASGVLAWQTEFRTRVNGYTELGAVREHTDGSLYVVGTTIVSNYSSREVFLAHLDSNGNVEWIQTFGSAGSDEYGKDLVILDDRLIVLGYQYGYSTNSSLAIQMDFDGTVMFE